MYKDVTDYPNQDLMDLHSAGWLFFGMDKHPEIPIQSTKQYVQWSNDDNAYRLRKDNGMCQLYISVEE